MAEPGLPPAPGEPPRSFAETPPPYAVAVDRGYIVETLMQMQATLGSLTTSVEHLRTDSQEHGRKLNRMSHVLFAAGVVLVIFGSVAGFILDKLWDTLIKVLAHHP